MTTFDDRERAAENHFAMEENIAFRITARRNKLVAHWAAKLMNLTPEEAEAYAKAVVQSDFEEAGDEDVVRKLLGDLTAAGVAMDDAGIRAALAEQRIVAQQQLSDAQ